MIDTITRFTGEDPSAAALYKELTPIIFPDLVATKVVSVNITITNTTIVISIPYSSTSNITINTINLFTMVAGKECLSARRWLQRFGRAAQHPNQSDTGRHGFA